MTMLTLLDKIYKCNCEYFEEIDYFTNICSLMKEHVSQYHSKHKNEYVEYSNGNKFIETTFIHDKTKFFIRIWNLKHTEKDMPLYTLYNNGNNVFFVNVEISNHSLRNDFMNSMMLALKNHYIMRINTEIMNVFDNNDEKNKLYNIIQSAIRPTYVIECIAENEELISFLGKYNDDKVDIILKLLIITYHNALSYINMDYFGEEEI